MSSNVSLTVYNSEGREVKTYIHANLPAGTHSDLFDGNGLSSDVYFFKLTTGDFSETNKMILVK